MTNQLLILSAVFCFTVKSVMTKLFLQHVAKAENHISLYQGIVCLFTALLFFLMGGFRLPDVGAIAAMGCLFGVLLYAASLCYATALEKGSMSLSSVILNMSLLIPVMYSACFNEEKISLYQTTGIILIFITIMLMLYKKRNTETPVTLRWFGIAFAAFLFNGTTAVMQKIYVLKNGEQTMLQLMAFGYMTAAVCFMLHHMLHRAAIPSERHDRLFILILALISAGGSFAGNAIQGRLCAVIDGAILYPCINGGLCIMTSCFSFLMFRERMTLRKGLAVFIGIFAIILLNL